MGQTEFIYNAFKHPQDSIPYFFEAAESYIVAHTHDVQNQTFAFHLPKKTVSPLFAAAIKIARMLIDIIASSENTFQWLPAPLNAVAIWLKRNLVNGGYIIAWGVFIGACSRNVEPAACLT